MQSLINAHLLWKGSVLAGGPVLFPLFLCLTPLLPTTDPQHSRQENLFVHLTACFLWEGASGREFDVWVTDPQVMLLGGTWSDQFEAENLPGHTGNGCCWVGFHPCLSSYFLKNPLLKVFFFFSSTNGYTFLSVSARTSEYSFFTFFATSGQGCNLLMHIVEF